MKKTKIIMGMPITVEVVGETSGESIENVFKYFSRVDDRFSTYKPTSEISKINNGLPSSKWSSEMKIVLDLCDQTKKLTSGYFDILSHGKLDPSGLVKGWAVNNAAQKLIDSGTRNFYIEAGGDIQVNGLNAHNQPWVIGIRNPFNIEEIVKVVQLKNQGMATSGTYIRGQHIYNPHMRGQEITDINSLTVIGPNVYEADRYATAAFAMGFNGIAFIDEIPGLEGYMIDSNKTATYTRGFESYEVPNV
jgi:thiamine biosynthesis lipoprotein